MKPLLLLIGCVFLWTGCSNCDDTVYEDEEERSIRRDSLGLVSR